MAIELGALDVVFRALGAEKILGAFRAIDTAGAKSAAGIDTINRRITLLSRDLKNTATRTQAIARLQNTEKHLTRTLQFGNTTFAQRIRLERELARTRAALAGRAVGVGGGGLLAGIGTVVGITALFQSYNKITDATDELRNSQERLRATAKITGTALSGLVSTADVGAREFRLSASQANNLSIEMAKLAAKAGDISMATPLLRAFLDLGAARGLDAEKTLLAVRQAILGIDEGTDKLFNANPSVLFKRYADSVGKSAASLTDQEKAIALSNAALEDGEKVRGQFQRWLETTAGLSAQQATEVTKSAEAFGKAIDPIRRLFLEFFTGAARLIGQHATFVTALIAIAGGLTLVVKAGLALSRIRWAALWASMIASPVLIASLITVGGLVFVLGKRWLDARLEMAKFRDEVGLLSADLRKLTLIDLAAQLAMRETELEAERAKKAATDAILDKLPKTGIIGTPLQAGIELITGRRIRDLKSEIGVLREKIDILRQIPAESGGTKPTGDGTGTQTRDDRLKALGEEVGLLTELATLGALTRDDIARALELEQRLTTELANGNNTRAQRVELEQRLLALREAGLSLAPQEIIDFRPGRGQARPDTEVLPGPEDFELPEMELTELDKRLMDAMDRVDASMLDASIGIGTTIAMGIGQGLAAALSGDNPLAALGEVLLTGFGSIMQQVGAALIEYGVIMTGLLPFLTNIFTSGPAAIAAGVALTALGAAFSGAFSGRGGRGGGGGGGIAIAGTSVPRGSSGFTRDERQHGITRTLPSGGGGTAPVPRQANNHYWTVIGARDPRVQREIMDIVDRAEGRGIGRRR